MADSFPRQKARTRNFTLGAPRSFSVAADGSRVVFLRSPAGDDPQTELWVFDVTEQRERRVAAPHELISGADEEVSVQERAQRERLRETAGGIVAYATDRNARVAAVALSGRLFVVDLLDGGARELDVPTPVFDPRPDPTGRQIAFVHDRGLYVVSLADGSVQRLTGDEAPSVSWGVAEFVAAEEMDRARGYWFAPDGAALLAARVDEAPVEELWISDAADPGTPPRPVRYPRAGSANAAVDVFVLRLEDGATLAVSWDRDAYPYLAAAHWDEHAPLLAVQTRDQRQLAMLAVDAVNGATEVIEVESDEAWVDLVPGVPRRLADGRLVSVRASGDATALFVAGEPVTPPELEVLSVIDVSANEIVFTASDDPLETSVWRWDATDRDLSALSSGTGVHLATSGGGTRVLGRASMDRSGVGWTTGAHEFASAAEVPILTPRVEFMTVGDRGLRTGLVLPRDHDGEAVLPVLMDPYGGPQFRKVLAAQGTWLDAQWLADQGFAVLIADGRGTPARGRAWARAVSGDLAGPVLDDQVAALSEVASLRPCLDLSRVAIRGWSFGGFIAALAVLRRPDIFHAAVAGAPVTDWRLYDTHYTERYLGTDPDGADREAYDGSSLLGGAASLRRPLLIVHGAADDNVLFANTLQLSQRLTEAGRPHSVLPLTGVTHMTPQEAVAENLLLLQVEFIRRALGIAPDG